jgi:hypothetical protein
MDFKADRTGPIRLTDAGCGSGCGTEKCCETRFGGAEFMSVIAISEEFSRYSGDNQDVPLEKPDEDFLRRVNPV